MYMAAVKADVLIQDSKRVLIAVFLHYFYKM